VRITLRAGGGWYRRRVSDGELRGAVLDGRYQLIEPLASGAMGSVWRGERVGLGRAVAIAAAEMNGEAERVLALRERLRRNLARRVPGLQVNGDLTHRLPGNLNVSFPGTTATDLIAACPSIAISTGSACTSAVVEPSYVLRALGLADDEANASIRVGIGRFNTASDVDFAADALAAAADSLQKRQPMTKAEPAPT